MRSSSAESSGLWQIRTSSGLSARRQLKLAACALKGVSASKAAVRNATRKRLMVPPRFMIGTASSPPSYRLQQRNESCCGVRPHGPGAATISLRSLRNSTTMPADIARGCDVTRKNPPKPRLTLRVGIVGHRPDKLGPDKLGTAGERIEAQLKEVFDAIDGAANAILKASQDCYAPDPPVVRLVSGFAQGADRMAVRLCPQDWQVEAILPFPRDKFATFSQEDAGAAEAPQAFAEVL